MLLLTVFATTILLSTVWAYEEKREKPCWLFRPVTERMVGAIGIAGAVSAISGNPIHKARLKAVLSLAAFHDLKPNIPELKKQIVNDETSFNVGDKTIRIIDHYHEDNMLFAYAAVRRLQPFDPEEISYGCNRTCMPQNCEPSWLCEPMDTQTTGFLGVSHRASRIDKQYQHAIVNGIQQVSFLYGVRIESWARFSTVKDALGVHRLNLHKSSIKQLGSRSANGLRFIMSDACYDKGKLYARITTPDLPPLSSVSSEVWMENPSPGEFSGAVGSAGAVASGLVSDQLALAIRRGIVNLAEANDIKISENMAIKKSTNGEYYYRDIRTDSDVTLHARVMGVLFKPARSGLDVFVWMVETTK